MSSSCAHCRRSRESRYFRRSDPLAEADGASRGIVVAIICPIKANSVEAFANQAEGAFASYRAAGAREAGVLVTLDVTNNFPQLPIRTDGPYLVWLGLVKDNETLERELTPVVRELDIVAHCHRPAQGCTRVPRSRSHTAFALALVAAIGLE